MSITQETLAHGIKRFLCDECDASALEGGPDRGIIKHRKWCGSKDQATPSAAPTTTPTTLVAAAPADLSDELGVYHGGIGGRFVIENSRYEHLRQSHSHRDIASGNHDF